MFVGIKLTWSVSERFFFGGLGRIFLTRMIEVTWALIRACWGVGRSSMVPVLCLGAGHPAERAHGTGSLASERCSRGCP